MPPWPPGCVDVGENYAQELVAKAEGAPAGVRWHFIGRLQRNKVRSIAPHVACGRASTGPSSASRSPDGRRGPPCSPR